MMVNTHINGRYDLLLPEHRAMRPEWDLEKGGGWEVKRIEAMITEINRLMSIDCKRVVFDIGTESADITAILSKYTNCDLVMFEPNDRVWSCIKTIWDANSLKKPLKFFTGFLSNENKGNYKECAERNYVLMDIPIVPDHGFKQLYENYPDVPQIRLDDYCATTGIYPDVITMDVEGAEFEVIKGAEKTLREKKPVIFMSIHPEFMYESYRNEGIWKEQYGERQHVVHMLRFIDELGYKHECIEYDYHELHMRFDPK